ncbi:40S ribosomal protein S11 [Salpingoeca rosetta]|uniref:Small ribosomal subunit protein uS17 n=1 Tax=Salpingoeca rosetta (strain ATCC 50818 / BSB-021) TaxID=946362 RepID=F2TY99_SALR5|nr:40S ribosomal protein S11 [Salpingoeca rosetta]EGD76358.1 40S ribosomal protein S11 [Salpingoeca rosetta]|eukprot:XP_004998533.1 40S ribosomal protein S11 [Salpingoeca rosetta]
MEVQHERAYQKQRLIFENKKRIGAAKVKSSELRFVKNVGLGFKTPREARELEYIDRKCPFTGDVSIRGRVLNGVVKTLKMQRTCVVRRDYLHFIPKYRRFEKRHKNLSVHVSPAFRDIAVGDAVTIGQCRPLSKTVRFNVLRVHKAKGAKKQFSKF